MVFGIDVSKWQGPIDWPAVAETEVQFAIIRATVGEHYTDEMWEINYAGAKQNGLLVGAYHALVGDPLVGVEDQIQNFRDATDSRELSLVSLDVERQDGATVQQLRDQVYRALKDMQSIGSPVVVYTGNWFWSERIGDRVMPKDPPPYGDNQPWSNDKNPEIRANGWPGWFASYGANNGSVPGSPEQPILPKGWRPGDEGTGAYEGYKIWQFTDRGKVPGISGWADLNLMSDEYFEELGGVAAPPPPPPPPDNLEERVEYMEETLARMHAAFHE